MNSIPVDQYDAKTGRWLATYLSITEASLLTGYSVATISKAIRGDLRTVDKKQYIFRSPKVEYKPKPKSNMANYKGNQLSYMKKMELLWEGLTTVKKLLGISVFLHHK